MGVIHALVRPRAGADPAAVYRPELQGLRALAVLLVMIYHVWVGRVSGGVDVFFVITGFLLTGQLVRAGEAGTLVVRQRWTRSFARLVPAAAVVLVSVVLAGFVMLPENRWQQTAHEVLWAALFAGNWELAADSADYAARSDATSVVQHFWSLGIQGQVVLAWPLLVAAVALSCRARPELLRGRTALLLLGLFAASLTYSIGLTAADQPLAYFHTLTRLWEFAAGGLLALIIDRMQPPHWFRVIAGWAGVLGLVACGALIPVADAFPGWVALWPVTCAVLVLVAGRMPGGLGADRILAGRVARRVGDLSYTLYLWHWPLLILVLAATGTDRVDGRTGAAILATSWALAELTHQLVERRVAGTRAAAAATVLVLFAAGGLQAAAFVKAQPSGLVGDSAHPGARVLAGGHPEAAQSQPLLPPLVSVTQDWQRSECTVEGCAPPRAGGYARRIVVVGDSHVQQLSAALEPIAAAHNWQVIDLVRGACPFSTVSEVAPDDAECTAWLGTAYDTILALRPDAVVTLATRNVREGLTEYTPPGFVEQWRRLGEAGIPVLAIRDNPRFDRSMPDCVANHGPDPAACGADRAQLYAPTPPWTRIPDLPRTVSFVDIADAVCLSDRCPAVIGNVLVYLDDNHLTATYAATMAQRVEKQVRAGLGW